MIINAKFINHVILPNEINLDLRDKRFINVRGLNGKGKSLLCSWLHPYSDSFIWTSPGGNPGYPIKPGKTGYKELIFKKGDVLYKISHEYVPKGEKHSCKSYLSIVDEDFNTIEELNPNGHNHMFKDLIEERLNFNSNLFSISYMAFNKSGLAQVEGAQRRKILNTMINLDEIDRLKDKINKRLLTNRKLVDYLNKEIEKDLKDLKVEELEHRIKMLSDSLTNIELDIENVNKEITSVKQSESESLKELEGLDRETSNLLQEIIKNNKDNINKKVGEIRKEKIEFESETKSKVSELDKLKTRLEDINEELLEISRFKVIIEKLDSNKNKLNDLNNKFKESFKNNIDTLVSILEKINKISITIDIDQDIDTTIEDITKEIDDINEFISEYKLKLQLSDTNLKSELISESCNSCKLFNIFKDIKSYLENNNKRFLDEQSKLPELKEYLNSLKDIKIKLDNIDKSDFDILLSESDYIKSKYNISNIINFIKSEGNIRLYNDLMKFKKSLSDLENEINELQSKLDNSKNIDKRDELEQENIKVSNMISEIYKFIKTNHDKYSYFRLETFAFDSKTICDLKYLIDIYNSKKEFIYENKIKINSLTENLNNLLSNRDDTKNIISDLTNKLNRLKKINEDIFDLSIQMDEDRRIKDILDKDLPLYLLSNKLRYIEDTINDILSVNDFPYEIHIEISDSNTIKIPVVIRNERTTPDVSNLSFGETTIISLLINSVISTLIGYNVLILDEMDSGLDVINRPKISNLIKYLINIGIEQIFYISQNDSWITDMENSTEILLGDCSMMKSREDSISISN